MAEGRSSIGVNEWDEPGWAMVGVLRDAGPKRDAKMRAGRDRVLYDKML